MTGARPHSSGVTPLADGQAHALLARVVERARTPGTVVAFDLDSTLLDNRPRQALILREYGAAHGVAPLSGAQAEHWQGWDAKVAMANAGLDPDGITRHLEDFRAYWRARFFTSAYCVHDVALPGAVGFVAALRATGTRLLYVTGRHEAMREGTIRCFARSGLPTPDGAEVELIMKPTLDEHDDAFKLAAYALLGRRGQVVAAFDNEPAHINGYRAAFPDAIVVHLATDHSLREIPVAGGIPSITSFVAFASG